MITQIDKIGFEIEGEFSDEAENEIMDYGEVGSDGSVHSCSSSEANGVDHHNLDCREFRSRPFARNRVDGEVAKIFDRLQTQSEKNGFHWNKSAGFHVHVSVKGDDGVFKAPELWSTDFCEYFTKKLAKEFPDMWLVRKNSYYSKAQWSDADIVRPLDRYRAINYMAYNEHRTIEFRIFRSDEPRVMYEYLKFTVDTIEEFCSKELVKKFTAVLGGTYNKRIRADAIELKPIDIDLGEFKVSTAKRPDYNISVVADGKKITKIL